MSKVVRVELGERSYDITVGKDLPVGVALSGERNVRGLIVSDSNVDPLYGEGCRRKLLESGIDADRAVVPAGESSKSSKQVSFLYEKAVKSNLDRSSCIAALGGGMVGDLAGFVAATFLRGIRLIHVPTSLLAMVDSSVGGKTGINLPQGKNLVGAFFQPVEVVADLSSLASLPRREYVSGLAEVVKYGVIRDAELFEMLESNVAGLLNRDPGLLEDVVARCCEIKAEVVASDEREESGLRAILNFGHTFGHALEKAGGYGTRLHGEAVATGMAYAAMLSVRQAGMPRSECDRLINLLKKLDLPVGAGPEKLPWKAIREAMTTDKKTRALVPRFVLAGRLGSVIIGCEVPEEVLAGMCRELTCRT